MSSTSTNPNVARPAPWRPQFESHLSKMSSPEFVFSSLTPTPPPSKHSPVTPFLPRARYCIFRGFWAELPENKHNAAPRNERAYASDCLTFTTDGRMQKVFEVFASSKGRADSGELVQGSGGGGPCEAVFWVKEEGVMVQWRVKGEAFVVGPDVEDGEGGSSGVRTVKGEVGKWMRVVDEGKREGWSWSRELRGHFGNVSPGMRGTFANPPPGQPVDKPYDDKNLKLGQKVEDLDDKVARSNFRVVIIVPESVESVDLSDPEKARRELYSIDDSTGEWKQQELWP